MNSMYESTPLEQAYSLYLAQQVFGIPPSTISTGVHIPGRSAVPFLTQSGIDRGILRLLWNVADPQNLGRLSTMKQFQVLLRLVAMAQNGMVQNHNNIQDITMLVQQSATHLLPLAAFSSIMIPPHGQLMTIYGQYLVQAPSMMSGIPMTTSIDDAFGGLVEVQDAPLGGMTSNTTAPPVSVHSMPPPQSSVPSELLEHRTSQLSAMSSLTDVSFGGGLAPPPPSQHRRQQLGSGSISEAFSDLGPAIDTPLPALGSVDSVASNTDSMGIGGGGGGGGETVSTGSVTATTFDSAGVMFSTTTTASSNMGGFLDNPSQQSAVTETLTEFPQEDEFGGFSSAQTAPFPAPTTAPTTMAASHTGTVDPSPSFGSASVNTNPTMDISDAFEIVGLEDAPLPSLDSFGVATLGTSANPALSEEEPASSNNDDFGDFSAPGSAPKSATTNNFGDISAAAAAATTISATTVSHVATVSDDDEDDDFGDFGSAAEPSVSGVSINDTASRLSGPVTMMQQLQPRQPFVADMGRALTEPVLTFTPAVTHTGRSLSLSDAFGDMGLVHDALNPSLDTIGAKGQDTTVSNPLQREEQDRFGGLETAFTSKSNPDEDFGDFGTASQSAGAMSTSANQDFMSFDNIEMNIPAVTDIVRSLSEPVSSSMGKPVTFPDHSRSLSIDEAFGDIPLPHDAPLPSLDFLGTSSVVDQAQRGIDSAAVEQNDDFGRFEEALPKGSLTVESVTEPQSVISSTNVGNFEAATSGLASTSNISPHTVAPMPAGDDFGDFGSRAQAPASESDFFGYVPTSQPSVAGLGRSMSELVTNLSRQKPETNIGRSLSIDDAFGDFAAQQDASLPSLGMFGGIGTGTVYDKETTHEEGQDETDGFGDFGQAAEIPSQSPGLLPSEETEDDFGGFTAASDPLDFVPSHTSLPSLDMFANGMEPTNVEFEHRNDEHDVDEFGTFEESKASPDADDFGAFEPSNLLEEKEDLGLFDAGQSVPSINSTEEDAFFSFQQAETPPSATCLGPTVSDPVSQAFSVGAGTGIGGVSSHSDPFRSIKAPPSASTTENDFFGGFEDARKEKFGMVDDFLDSPVPATASQDSSTMKSIEEAVVSEDFGNFGVTDESNPEQPKQPSDYDDDFGAFGSADQSDLAQSVQYSQSYDKFGAFSGADESTVSHPEAGGVEAFRRSEQSSGAEPAQVIEPDDDDFGDFGSAEFAPTSEANIESKQSKDPFATEQARDAFVDFDTAPAQTAPTENIDEHLGDFAAVEPPTTANDDDNFGDFSDFSAFEQSPPLVETSSFVPVVATASKSLDSGDDDDDWGDFDNAASPTQTEEERIRDRIRSLSLQLPGSLLLKAGHSGDHVDLGEAFEVHIGIKPSLDSTQVRRVKRCVQVLESLSKDKVKLASTYWLQVFELIMEELDVTTSVISEAKALSSADWKKVENRLSTMLAGLAEYMRVTRSIVASIGDLLLLDESALLTIDTWASTWCSLSILERAVEIEKRWKTIQTILSGTTLKANTVTLEKIRSRAILPEAPKKLCELTLQPIWQEDHSTTQAEVLFQGKCFMACSANFLANRCPFVVVANDD